MLIILIWSLPTLLLIQKVIRSTKRAGKWQKRHSINGKALSNNWEIDIHPRNSHNYMSYPYPLTTIILIKTTDSWLYSDFSFSWLTGHTVRASGDMVFWFENMNFEKESRRLRIAHCYWFPINQIERVQLFERTSPLLWQIGQCRLRVSLGMGTSNKIERLFQDDVWVNFEVDWLISLRIWARIDVNRRSSGKMLSF